MFFNLISIVFVNGFNIAGPEAQQKSYKESRLLKAHLNSANAEAEKYTDSNKRWSRVDKKKKQTLKQKNLISISKILKFSQWIPSDN